MILSLRLRMGSNSLFWDLPWEEDPGMGNPGPVRAPFPLFFDLYLQKTVPLFYTRFLNTDFACYSGQTGLFWCRFEKRYCTLLGGKTEGSWWGSTVKGKRMAVLGRTVGFFWIGSMSMRYYQVSQEDQKSSKRECPRLYVILPPPDLLSILLSSV